MLLRIGVPLAVAVVLGFGALWIAVPDRSQARPDILAACAGKTGDARDLCRDQILLRRNFER